MLAGKMKLNHFLLILGLGLAAACGGVFLLPASGILLWSQNRPAAPVVATHPVRLDPPPAEPQTLSEPQSLSENTPPPVVASEGVNPWDEFLLKQAGKNLGTDKIKDATKGTTYKVNLYQDTGKNTVNRAKVDIDRDDKWDEKWTYADNGITVERAPGDDENYTERVIWAGGIWKPE